LESASFASLSAMALTYVKSCLTFVIASARTAAAKEKRIGMVLLVGAVKWLNRREVGDEARMSSMKEFL
jgi:hypothetical protein